MAPPAPGTALNDKAAPVRTFFAKSYDLSAAH